VGRTRFKVHIAHKSSFFEANGRNPPTLSTNHCIGSRTVSSTAITEEALQVAAVDFTQDNKLEEEAATETGPSQMLMMHAMVAFTVLRQRTNLVWKIEVVAAATVS
jgi:hypothetical protein